MILIEKEAEKFLENEGFDVIDRFYVTEENKISKVPLNFPWVMKASGKKIIHKRKIGGIKLNIKNIEEAAKTFHELKKLESFEGVIIQPQIKGQELILGLKYTQDFGIVIMVGAGGSRVEEKKDVAFRVCPIKKEDAWKMLHEIKIEVINKKAVKKNLLKLSRIAEKYPNIKELDINPLFIDKEGGIVVDARIVK